MSLIARYGQVLDKKLHSRNLNDVNRMRREVWGCPAARCHPLPCRPREGVGYGLLDPTPEATGLRATCDGFGGSPRTLAGAEGRGDA
jgi:hypothetical protein